MHDIRTHEPLTETEFFLLTVPDDTEEQPWMVMGDPQFWSATEFAATLESYRRRHNLPWYVAGMLPILYRRPTGRKGQVAPDVLVARGVGRHKRHSYDLEAEGVFPRFVLELLSPSSIDHDLTDKLRLYDVLGAQEYVIFAPEPGLPAPPLQGYRRGASGGFAPWLPEDDGRMWSAELGLYLAAEGGILRAYQPDGQPLPTRWESEQAQAHAEQAQMRAEQAQQRAEDEVARLRAELERIRGVE